MCVSKPNSCQSIAPESTVQPFTNEVGPHIFSVGQTARKVVTAMFISGAGTWAGFPNGTGAGTSGEAAAYQLQLGQVSIVVGCMYLPLFDHKLSKAGQIFRMVCLDKELVTVVAPIKNDKAPGGFETVELEMLDPHALVAFLFNDCGVVLPDEKVARFWQHHEEVKSPFLTAYDGTHFHVPVGLYGDGAKARQQAYQLPEKVVGIFLNLPLWRPKSSRLSRFLIFAIEEDLCFGRRTLNAIYARITWSLNHMFFGKWPEKGPAGENLTDPRAGTLLTPDGKKFALTEHRGDWSFMKWVLGFRSSWKAGTTAPVCYRCSAWGKGPPATQYFHVGENAATWATEYNRTQFILNEMPAVDPCLLA